MKRFLGVEDFENRMEQIELNHSNKFKAYDEIIHLCRNILSEWRKKVTAKGFTNPLKEIEFFKVVKQLPLVNLLYYSEIYSFEVEFPKGDIERQKRYAKKRINKLNRFFLKHIDFVQYIELGKHHLDEYFFTRKYTHNLSPLRSKSPFLDSTFNTSHDLLLGQLKAYQLLNDYLSDRLNDLDSDMPRINSNLKWTSSKVSLTELVYALYHSNAINNGTADIKQIANVLQNVFNFELGDYYRTYSEIRGRQKSRVKFLDELTIGMLQSMDNERV